MSEVSVRAMLNQHLQRPAATMPRESDEEAGLEYKAFSFGRVGNRTQSMVSFLKRDGSVEVFCYADLRRISAAVPSRQILLKFSDQLVVIHGTHLETILRYLKQWRCDEITEVRTIDGMSTDPQAPTVEEIVFKPLARK